MKRNPASPQQVFQRFHHGNRTSIWPESKRVQVEIPDYWDCTGDAILIWYLSDKLLDDTDGKTLEAYEHEFESQGVRVYYPDEGGEGGYLLPRVPHDWTILGVCQGWALRDDGEGEAVEVEVDNCKLLWDEHTRTLGVLDEGTGELSCLIFGGKLRVTKDGIEG